MISRRFRWVLLLLVLLLLLPVGLYWLADTWLESSGGRRMLEQELGARFGMSVHLEGEFDLMLLPDIGVSGTDLRVGLDANANKAFASSREFEVSVLLKPLFQRQVVVDWIRLTGGRVFPDRYSGAGDTGGSVNSRLPEIRELTLRDFEIVIDEAEGASLRVETLSVTNFAEGRETPFVLDIEDLVSAQGRLLWDTAKSNIKFHDLQFRMAGQVLSGSACLLLLQPPVLSAELEAGEFDFDLFLENLPDLGQSGAGEGGDLPLDIRARFVVEGLHSNGVIARGVVLSLGQDPIDMAVCGSD